jgi:hypothetical protein
MRDKFKKDIDTLLINLPDFWSVCDIIAIEQLSNMQFDLIYGAYLKLHGVRFLSANGQRESVSVVIRDKYHMTSLRNLDRLIFTDALVRIYNIHLITNV